MKNAIQVCTTENARDEMNVVWHHTPRDEVISLMIEVLPGLDHDFRDFWDFQMAGATALVEKFIETTVKPLRNASALHFAQRPLVFESEFLNDLSRQ